MPSYVAVPEIRAHLRPAPRGAALDPTPNPTPAVHTIGGTLALIDPNAYSAASGDCTGLGGFGDIQSGVSVVMRDGAGAIIGSAPPSKGITIDSSTCDVTFRLERVPDAAFYVITIGGRDGPTYSRADMNTMNWDVALVIGE